MLFSHCTGEVSCKRQAAGSSVLSLMYLWALDFDSACLSNNRPPAHEIHPTFPTVSLCTSHLRQWICNHTKEVSTWAVECLTDTGAHAMHP